MESYAMVLSFFEKTEAPANAGAVAEATGLDKKEVNKVMTKLKKEEKIVSPKRCYWEIKK
ncbi:MAG: MarR family transcriptional regulator [Sporolactobacillus sp.]